MPEQLRLFADSDGFTRIGAAAPQTKVVEIASRLAAEIHLGTCSWSFPGWKGIVYDRDASMHTLARYGLSAYARHPLFRTVCVDRTYYGPIGREAFRSYAEQVPEGFRFVVKAHEFLTRATSPHYLDRDYAEREVIGPCIEGLGTKAAVMVFQFPPQAPGKLGAPDRFSSKLERFLQGLPVGLAYAVELRNRELLTEQYVEALAAAGAAHAFNVHPTMPSVAEQARLVDVSRAGLVVVRWMLRRDRGYEDAREAFEPFDRLRERDASARSAIAALCREATARGQQAYVVVNNKAEGSAPLSLIELAEALTAHQAMP